MTYSKNNKKTTSKSVYEMVTGRIIEELENGIIPWEKPWSGGFDGAFNRVSKRQYSLINQCMLKHTGEYATYKQWLDIDHKLHPEIPIEDLKPIKSGEKSEFVVFWKICPIRDKNKDTGEEETKNIPVLKYFNVFHISQTDIEGLEPLSKKDRKVINPIEEAEGIIDEYTTREGIRFERCLSDKAYYSPVSDYVCVPELSQFNEVEEGYSTYFHELTHSTGHKSRLNRFDSNSDNSFGSESYSKEELVAEMGSAMILNRLGIESSHSFRNSTAYIQGWLKALKNDVRLVTSASSKAEKAVKLILNEGQEEETEETE